jgi:hypothetical protein
MLCPAQSPNLHCSLLVAYTPYQEQKSKNHQRVMYLWLGQKRWRDPATTELLRHRLQRASYGASGSGPHMAVLLEGLLRQWGSALGLQGGDPTTEGLGADTEGPGLALALLGGASVAAGLSAGVEGRGSGGSGAQH